ncbi:MAG: hypothetical protein AAF333_04080 [Planctomycetota bacterium]
MALPTEPVFTSDSAKGLDSIRPRLYAHVKAWLAAEHRLRTVASLNFRGRACRIQRAQSSASAGAIDRKGRSEPNHSTSIRWACCIQRMVDALTSTRRASIHSSRNGPSVPVSRGRQRRALATRRCRVSSIRVSQSRVVAAGSWPCLRANSNSSRWVLISLALRGLIVPSRIERRLRSGP